MTVETVVLPADHFHSRVVNQYRNVPTAIVREILQNSVDAGATTVVFCTRENGYTASDNGHGMTLEAFRKYFLCLGGSRKSTGSLGGFGAAKEVLAYAWGSWKAELLDAVVTGNGCANVKSEPSTRVKGFSISADDPSLDGSRIRRAVAHVMARSSLPCKVILDTEQVWPARKQVKGGRGLAAFPWGKVYRMPKDTAFSPGYLTILAGGLYSAEEYTGLDYPLVVDVTRGMPPQEVFTESRDSLLYDHRQAINDLTAQANKRDTSPVDDTLKVTIYRAKSQGGPVRYSQGAARRRVSAGDTDSDGNEVETCYAPKNPLPYEWTVVNLTNKASRVKLGRGWNRDLLKVVHVTHEALTLLCGRLGIDVPTPGLVIGKGEDGTEVRGINLNCGTVVGVSAEAGAANKYGYALLDLLLHELAHNRQGGHRQEFECERRRLADMVAPYAGEMAQAFDALIAGPGVPWKREPKG